MASYIENFPSQMDWLNTFKRTGKFPLDRSSMFKSKADAELYAQGGKDSRGLSGISYIGQIISVYENDNVKVFKINADKSLSELGTIENVNSLQSQLDTIESNVGLTEKGGKPTFIGNYANGEKTIVEAIGQLDTALKITDDNIAKLNLEETGLRDGSKYVNFISQSNGKVTAMADTFDSELNADSTKAPQTKVVDAAFKKAKTEVVVKGDGFVKVSVNTEADGHSKVTVSENDIASASNLNKEISNRETAISTLLGDAAEGYNTLGKLEDKVIEENKRASQREDEISNSVSNEIKRASDEEKRIKGLVTAETERATAAELDNTNAINGMELASQGEDGSFIKTVSQTKGKVTVTTDTFDTVISLDTGSSTKAPQTKAVKTYVDTEIQNRENEIDRIEKLVTAETTNRTNAIGTKDLSGDNVYGAILEEKTRATAAEKANTNAIEEEKTRATAAEQGLRTDLGVNDNKEGQTAFDRIKSLETAVGEGGSVSTQISSAIDALDKPDNADQNKYVSSVSEENGVITVSRANLIGNNGNDSVLSIDAEKGGIKSTIKLLKVTENLEANVKEAYKLVGKDGATQLGDLINVYKDRSLKSAEMVTENDVHKQGQYLKLTYYIDSKDGEQVETPVYVDMSQLIHESEVENGIQNHEGKLSVKLDTASKNDNRDSYLKVDGFGLRTEGISNAIKAAKTELAIASDLDSEHLTVSTASTNDNHVKYLLHLKDIATQTELDSEKSTRETQDDAISTLLGNKSKQSSLTATTAFDAIEEVNTTLTQKINDAKASATTEVSGATDDNTNKHLEIADKGQGHKSYEIKLKDVASATDLDNEISRATAAEQDLRTDVDNLKIDLGEKGEKGGTAFGRIESLEAAVGEGGSVSTQISSAINALNSGDALVENEFVTKVNQTNGKVIVSTKAKILDKETPNNVIKYSEKGLYLDNVWDCGTF